MVDEKDASNQQSSCNSTDVGIVESGGEQARKLRTEYCLFDERHLSKVDQAGTVVSGAMYREVWNSKAVKDVAQNTRSSLDVILARYALTTQALLR